MKELQEMRLHFKRLSKRNFLKVGKGDARGGRADREGVCETCLCNCSDIFIESPPSLSCVLQRASLTPVDGESSRGAVFSIIPEAIVRAASDRLTVASWDFTKTQQNTRRRRWDRKIRGGGGVRVGKELGRETGLVVVMWKKCQILCYMNSEEEYFVCKGCWVLGGGREAAGSGWLWVSVVERAARTASKRQGAKCEMFFSPGGLHLLALIQSCNSIIFPLFFFETIANCFDLQQWGIKRLSKSVPWQHFFYCAMIITLS